MRNDTLGSFQLYLNYVPAVIHLDDARLMSQPLDMEWGSQANIDARIEAHRKVRELPSCMKHAAAGTYCYLQYHDRRAILAIRVLDGMPSCVA